MPRPAGETGGRWSRAIEDARLTDQVVRGGRPSDRLQLNHEGRSGAAEVGARAGCYAQEHPDQAREFVRLETIPTPIDHPERLPIPEPAGTSRRPAPAER